MENDKKHWVVIPRRKRLDPDKWEIITDGRPDIDYMFLAYPYERPFDISCGLHGDKDDQRGRDRKDIMIDDTMSMQGSCYFMTKDYFNKLELLDDVNFSGTGHEGAEIALKVRHDGGRIIVNKNTWYAHARMSRKYAFDKTKSREYIKVLAKELI